MTRIDLEEPRFKVARAVKHYQELAEAVTQFFAQQPFGVEHRRDQVPGYTTVHARVYQPVPKEIAGVVGDLIHNLRSALEYLAWQAEIANGKTPDKKTKFPVYDFRAAQWSTEKQRKELRGDQTNHKARFGSAAYAIVIEMHMPVGEYESELGPLWMINTIDIHDKHHKLNVVGGAARVGNFNAAGPGVVSVEELMTFPGGDRHIVPFVDGLELMRVRLSNDSTTGMSYHYRYFLAFGHDGPGKGQELMQTCGRLIQFVDESLERFAALT